MPCGRYYTCYRVDNARGLIATQFHGRLFGQRPSRQERVGLGRYKTIDHLCRRRYRVTRTTTTASKDISLSTSTVTTARPGKDSSLRKNAEPCSCMPCLHQYVSALSRLFNRSGVSTPQAGVSQLPTNIVIIITRFFTGWPFNEHKLTSAAKALSFDNMLGCPLKHVM